MGVRCKPLRKSVTTRPRCTKSPGTKLLLESKAARQVEGMLALEPAVAALLADPAAGQAMGRAGREVLKANRGALHRLVGLIENS